VRGGHARGEKVQRVAYWLRQAKAKRRGYHKAGWWGRGGESGTAWPGGVGGGKGKTGKDFGRP